MRKYDYHIKKSQKCLLARVSGLIIFDMKVILSIFIILLAGCSTIKSNSSLSLKDSNKSEVAPQVSPISNGVVAEVGNGFSLEKRPLSEVILDHKYFVVSYNKEMRIANYVSYELTKEQVAKSPAERDDRFFPDPQLKKLGIDPILKKDYVKTGFDRGHLANSEDFAFSQVANDETFVMSNMTPQSPDLNRKSWRLLELRVRKWACGEEKIRIVTGPVLEPGLKKLRAGVAIPNKFFKAVLDETPPKKTICFIYNQTDATDVYKDRVMSVKDCERQIGFQLFPELLKNDQHDLEGKFDLKDWSECGKRQQ